MRINRAIGLGIAIIVLKLLMFGVMVGFESLLITAFETGEVMLQSAQVEAPFSLPDMPR